ncbi:MAG TPA: hypothetical protein VMR37_08460 [Rhabdochlamydiaceae bacterium]|nr:hypothetical protein [Rhabdochlamydiaceae bacterium]
MKDFNCIQYLIDALNFYANEDNYWNDPLDMKVNWDIKTLQACHASKKGNKILEDGGETAWQAICKFDEHIKLLKALEEGERE